MKSHCVLTSLFIIMEMADQALTLLIEVYYEELGRQNAFKIWWSFHLFFLINIYITANLYIYFDSKENFPELGSFNISFIKIYNIVSPLSQTNTTIPEMVATINPAQENHQEHQ